MKSLEHTSPLVGMPEWTEEELALRERFEAGETIVVNPGFGFIGTGSRIPCRDS